jgi:Helix-turn-helix domain
MRKTVKRGELISQAEAARIRGVSQQAIANLIRRGRLASVSVAGRTLVLRTDVETFIPKPKQGRPPKKAGRKTAKRSKAPK